MKLRKILTEILIENKEEEIQQYIDIIDMDSEKYAKYIPILKSKYGVDYVPASERYNKDIEAVNKLANKTIKSVTKNGKEITLTTEKVKDLERSIQIEGFMDGELVGRVGFNINIAEKSLMIGGAKVIEKYQRQGIYTVFVDYIQSVCDDLGLSIVEGGRSQSAKDFWKNRNS